MQRDSASTKGDSFTPAGNKDDLPYQPGSVERGCQKRSGQLDGASHSILRWARVILLLHEVAPDHRIQFFPQISHWPAELVFSVLSRAKGTFTIISSDLLHPTGQRVSPSDSFSTLSPSEPSLMEDSCLVTMDILYLCWSRIHTPLYLK